jgi:hypothetical protein
MKAALAYFKFFEEGNHLKQTIIFILTYRNEAGRGQQWGALS